MAIYDDKLIVATSDAHIIALDAKTGKVVWDHATADWNKGWRYTGGPFVGQRQGHPGHDRLRQRRAGRLLHHRPRHQHRRRVVARQHHRASRRSELRYLERPAAGEAASAPRPGFPAATIPNRTWCSTAPASPIRGSPKCAARCRTRPGAKNNALYSDSTLAINPDTGKLDMVSPAPCRTTPGTSITSMSGMLVDLPVNGETRKARGDHRQARHHRGARPHQRPVAVAQGDGAAERRRGDRSEDRREDHQRRRRSRISARPR